MTAVDVKRGSPLESDVEARTLLVGPAVAATAGRSAWGGRLGVVASLALVVGLASAWLVARPTGHLSPMAEPADAARLGEAGGVHCKFQGESEVPTGGPHFDCGAGSSCCGDVCLEPGGTCCAGVGGDSFDCGAGSSCCGDVCLEPGGTCCAGVGGDSFPCGPHSSCCGDTCLGHGGTCCKNELGEDFPCSKGNQCCGNTCAPPKNKCCTDSRGTKYAVSSLSPCISELKNCTNLRGDLFFCGTGSECCGDMCMAPGAVCCKNNAGFEAFSCGEFSTCCGYTCAAPGSRCCVDNWGSHFPVAAHPGGFDYPWEKKIYENCSKAVTGDAPQEPSATTKL